MDSFQKYFILCFLCFTGNLLYSKFHVYTMFSLTYSQVRLFVTPWGPENLLYFIVGELYLIQILLDCEVGTMS